MILAHVDTDPTLCGGEHKKVIQHEGKHFHLPEEGEHNQHPEEHMLPGVCFGYNSRDEWYADPSTLEGHGKFIAYHVDGTPPITDWHAPMGIYFFDEWIGDAENGLADITFDNLDANCADTDLTPDYNLGQLFFDYQLDSADVTDTIALLFNDKTICMVPVKVKEV